VGFSPDGQYVAAFDAERAFVWSSTSFQLLVQYPIVDPYVWFLNTNHLSVMPPPEPLDHSTITLVFEPSQPVSSPSCVLFRLQGNSGSAARPDMEMVSRAIGTVPLLSSNGDIWLKGHKILAIPDHCRNPKSCLINLPSWSPTTRSRDSLTDIALPIARDGMRFLICDEKGFPVVVDISKIAANILRDCELNRFKSVSCM
jgi:hypothetical protein